MTILKWLIVLLALTYMAGLAVLFFNQRSMLFPIPTAKRTSPQVAGLPQAVEHVLSTADGEQIIVWHIPAKPGHKVILYFPGNGDFLAGRVDRFLKMTSDGTGLVTVSYRGYAGSSGHPTEEGLLQDATAAYAFTRARYPAANVVVWGFSLGTGVAVALAADHPVSQLILEAPYTSTADVAAATFPFVPVRYLMKDQFRSDQRISRVSARLLVMHGESDPGISISFGKRLFALAPGPKQFVGFPNGGHDNLDDFGAIEAARRFIAETKG
jgi:uncharacterized protein